MLERLVPAGDSTPRDRRVSDLEGVRMQTNLIKRQAEQGDVTLGTFIFEFNTSGIGRIAAAAGAQFAIFDMEHTGWSVETIRQLVAVSRGVTMPAYVRIPAGEYHFVARVLDMGAMGVMTPMVGSAEQAERIVAAAKYPPTGRRGAAFGIAHDDYRGGEIVAKMQAANDNVHMIMQIETREGVENAEQVAAVDGVDVLWIGHFDLSCSLGIPGQFDHPEFQTAVQTVLDACRKYNKTPGFMAGDVEHGQRLLDDGFRMIAYGGDLWLYQTALRNGLAKLQAHADQV